MVTPGTPKTPATTLATSKPGRSPGYPGISLPEAIEKAKILWKTQRTNAVAPQTAMEALGYKAGSGTSRRVIAALLQFGLLSEEGKGDSRKLRLTEDARQLALLPDGHEDAPPIIREMALRPKIYSEMIAKWPETLPLDREIRLFLTRDKSYNEDTVPGLIEDFRKTYEFAELGNREGVEDAFSKEDQRNDRRDRDESAKSQEQQERSKIDQGRQIDLGGRRESQVGTDKDLRTYTLPIGGSRVAYLQVPFDMSNQDFDLLGLSLKVIQLSVVGTGSKPDFEVFSPPKVRKGPATWAAKDADYPIVVSGYLGMKENRHYASIEDSTAGVPLDEIVYDNDTEV
jgi:hypothetical protein